MAAKSCPVGRPIRSEAALNLVAQGLAMRSIARVLDVDQTTVARYVRVASKAGDPRVPPPRPNCSETAEAVMKLRAEGMSRECIAGALGVHLSTVAKHVRAGKDAGDPRAARPCRANARIEAILNLCAAGMSRAGIAAAVGVHVGTVCQRLRDAAAAGDPRVGPTMEMRREAILDAWAAGVSGPEIAVRHGVEPIVIRKMAMHARKRGDPRAALRQHPLTDPVAVEKAKRRRAATKARPADYVPLTRRTPDEAAALQDAVLSAWADGLKISGIASACGIPKGYVGSMLDRLREAGDPRATWRRGART